MKKLIFTVGASLFFQISFAQVAIGKTSITNDYVSLEFGNVSNNPDLQKGVLLPWVSSVNDLVSPTPGTMIYDTNDKKIKILKGGTDPKWFDLTLGDNGMVDTTLQDNLVSNEDAQVRIGSNESETKGILVLEDTNKAMILPLIDDYKSIENPSPGMMAYDTTNNMLCVFNGTQWTFWKEN